MRALYITILLLGLGALIFHATYPARSFALVSVHMGEAETLDTGLSYEDCQFALAHGALEPIPGETLSCEVEGAF